jgi:hypothetical protein
MASKYLQLLSGWFTLPDELKVEILRYTLPRGLNYTASIFNAHGPTFVPHDEYIVSVAAVLYQNVVVTLLSLPAIRHLVAQVFYEQNTINVKYREFYQYHGSILAQRTLLPPVHDRHLIRHLEVDTRQVDTETIRSLQRLAAPAAK